MTLGRCPSSIFCSPGTSRAHAPVEMMNNKSVAPTNPAFINDFLHRSQGRNLALTGLHVPCSLDCGRTAGRVAPTTMTMPCRRPKSKGTFSLRLKVLGLHLIPTTIYHKYSSSLKVTTHLDHISYCKTRSGTNW